MIEKRTFFIDGESYKRIHAIYKLKGFKSPSALVNQAIKDALVAYKGCSGAVISAYNFSADTGTTVIPGRRGVAGNVSAIRYNANAARLEIVASGPFRIEILRVDGKKMFSGRSRVIDLSGLRPGVYLARLVQKGQIDVKTFLR